MNNRSLTKDFNILDTPSSIRILQNHSTNSGLPTDCKGTKEFCLSVFSYIPHLFSAVYNCHTPSVLCGKYSQAAFIGKIINTQRNYSIERRSQRTSLPFEVHPSEWALHYNDCILSSLLFLTNNVLYSPHCLRRAFHLKWTCSANVSNVKQKIRMCRLFPNKLNQEANYEKLNSL